MISFVSILVFIFIRPAEAVNENVIYGTFPEPFRGFIVITVNGDLVRGGLLFVYPADSTEIILVVPIEYGPVMIINDEVIP